MSDTAVSPPRVRPGTRRSLRLSQAARPATSQDSSNDSDAGDSFLQGEDDTIDAGSNVSSDDDEAVFLGNHRPEEQHLITRLSSKNLAKNVEASSIGSASTSRRQSRRRSSLMLQTRDSREFHRRKTILFSADDCNSQIHSPRTSPEKAKKIWQGGFYERREQGRENDSDSDGECSTGTARVGFLAAKVDTPSQHTQQPCDLTLDCANFHLSGSPFKVKSPSIPSRLSLRSEPPSWPEDEEEGAGEDDPSDVDGDSDKENLAVPFEEDQTDSEVEEESGPSQPVSIMSLLLPPVEPMSEQSEDEQGALGFETAFRVT